MFPHRCPRVSQSSKYSCLFNSYHSVTESSTVVPLHLALWGGCLAFAYISFISASISDTCRWKHNAMCPGKIWGMIHRSWSETLSSPSTISWAFVSQTAWGCLVLVTAAVLGTYYLFGQYKICRIGNRRPYAANAMHVMWFPGELELTMFCIYSPAHALLWIMTTDVNWMWSMFVMVILSVQVCLSN